MIRRQGQWSAWVAHSVTDLTLDLGSDFHLMVMSSNPVLGSGLGMEPTKKKERKNKRRKGKEKKGEEGREGGRE